MIKKILLTAMFAATLGGIAAPAAAEVYVRVGPPPMREEVVPERRPGYLWAPGHWNYRHGRHVWVRGNWNREREGYHYNHHRWEEREGRWVQRRGGWERD